MKKVKKIKARKMQKKRKINTNKPNIIKTTLSRKELKKLKG